MYQSPNKREWQGRIDALDGEAGYRWHQVINMLDLTQDVHITGTDNNIAFLGFCCDEGVKRNKGRIGAQNGPDELRKAMASLPVHFNRENISLFDAGNVICPNHNMEKAQGLLGLKVNQLLEQKFIPVLLGGGHEIAYGHYLGIHRYLRSHELTDNLGIINIDAHFDLRNYEKEPSSGTPFLQISSLRKNHDLKFNYLVLGIQQAGNTPALFQTAQRLNTQYIFAEDIREVQLERTFDYLDVWMEDKTHIYLTVDLDGIAAAHAPGVSAPTPAGLDPFVVNKLIQKILESGKLLTIDFAELSPVHDQDSRTAKLAAWLIFNLITNSK